MYVLVDMEWISNQHGIPAILLGCRQAVKAPVSDTGICWFESNHPSHTWRVNPEGLGTAR